jgi:hypothetical protein
MAEDFDDIAAIKLFKAIIIQAFHDACAIVPKPYPQEMPKGFKPKRKSKHHPEVVWQNRYKARIQQINEIERAKREAQDWLLGRSRDFRRICDLAQWGHEYISAGARKLQAKGWKAPKNLPDQSFLEAA